MIGTITSVILIAAAGFIGWRVGIKSKQSKEYWRGRGEGWQACEGMVIDRAKGKLYDKDGLLMERDKVWEALIQ